MNEMRLAIALLLVATSTAAAEEKITRVVLFEDRAQVERSHAAALPAGACEVAFENLPADAIEPSLFASIAEGAGRVLGLRIERDSVNAELRTPAGELESQLRAKMAAALRLDRRLEVSRKISALTAAYSDLLYRTIEEQSTALSWTLAQSDASLNAIRNLSEWEADLAEERALLEKQRADLERELEQLRGRFRSGPKDPPRETRRAVVLLEMAAAGNAVVRLSYEINGAAWSPRYEARLDEARGVVELGVLAEIRQSSGEEWKDVALELSNARSTLGFAAPRLSPLRIAAAPRSRGIARASAAAERSWLAEEEKAESEPPPIERRRGPARFTIPAPVTLAGDGQMKVAAIARFEIAAVLAYQAAPRVKPSVYRRADLSNTSPLVLLAGPIRVFRGGEFCGETELGDVLPGQGFSLHFGVEPGLTARRIEMRRETDAPAVFSGKRTFRIGHRLELSSQLDREATVRLTDAIPVSELPEVNVELGKETQPRPAGVSRDGHVDWRVTLAPGERSAVILEYIITLPAGLDLPIEAFE